MISPFEVYLVMQMDKIITATSALVFLLSMATTFVSVAVFVTTVDGHAAAAPWKKLLKRVGAALILSGALYALLPDSKTLAAMILVPALTSDAVVEPLTAEAKDLYGLAKRGLTTIIEDAEQEKSEAATAVK